MEEAAGKSEVSQVPARAGEKAVGSKAPYLTNIATAARDISAAVGPTITRDNHGLG